MASTARPPGAAPPEPRTRPWDLIGLGLLLALGAWTLVASVGQAGARPLPVVVLLLGSAALFTLGRLATLRRDDVVPRLVALAIGGAFLLTFPGVMSSGGAPTEYGNTNGTLAGLGVIAALVCASGSRDAARHAWVLLAVALVACVGMSESVAAGAALIVAAALAAVALLRRDAAVASLGGLVATWLALGATTALAARSSEPDFAAEQTLRIRMWAHALDLARDAPLRGHGPGTFRPPLVDFDLDLRWAHHEYLQLAAELGVVALVLLLLFLAWLFAYLWWGRSRGLVRTVAGASAVTFVALHATVDHVLHTAVVPLTLAILMGWATADRRGPGTPGSHPPRP